MIKMEYDEFMNNYIIDIEQEFCKLIDISERAYDTMNEDQREIHKDYFKAQWNQAIQNTMQGLLPEVQIYD